MVQGVQAALQLGDLAVEGQALLLAVLGLLLGFGLPLPVTLQVGLLVAEGPLGQGRGLLHLRQIGLPGLEGRLGRLQLPLQGLEGVPGFRQAGPPAPGGAHRGGTAVPGPPADGPPGSPAPGPPAAAAGPGPGGR